MWFECFEAGSGLTLRYWIFQSKRAYWRGTGRDRHYGLHR
jgi:hypothetical protein